MLVLPENLNLITRRIYYNYPARQYRKYVLEELVIENNSDKAIFEVIIETERFKPDLKIVDKSNKSLIYLPKYKMLESNRRNMLPDDIIKKLEKDDIYLLWIILNEPLLPGAQEKISMAYFAKPKIRKILHYYDSIRYVDIFKFYGKETLSVSASIEDGISLDSKYKRIAPMSTISKKGDRGIIIDDIAHWESGENCFSYSISYEARIKNDIEFIVHLHVIVPEKSERHLVFSLVLFALIFPFTGIFLLIDHLESISYVFDIIEVEVVLILTLGVTQFRSKLINPKNLIIGAVIFMAFVSILNLWFLLR